MAEDITNFDDQFEEQSQMADFLGPAKIGVNLPNSGNIIQQNPTYQIKDNTVGSAPNIQQSPATQLNPAQALVQKMLNLDSNYIDNTHYNKPYTFDSSPAGAHKARYKAYGQEVYDRIGFDPMIDNETWFTSNTTALDDAKRWLTHSAAPMLGLGMLANPRSYGKILSDFDFGGDINEAEKYEEYNQLGYSTRGGVSGFLVNLGNSASYSAGILLEGALEGALIGGAVGFMEGGVGAIPGAAIGGFTGMFKNIPALFKSIGKGTVSFTKTLAGINKLKNATVARAAWKNAGKTVGNFANPFSNTKNAAMQYVFKNPDDLTNLARTARTAGAFMHDIKNINMALSEGRLEGGFSENEIYTKLYNDYYDEHGVIAPDHLQQEYRLQAKAGSFFNTMANTSLVFYTNKIAFPSITQARFIKGVPRFSKRVGRVGKNNIVFKPGKTIADDLYSLERANFKNAVKSLAKPATYGRVSLNYFKGNLMEGVQEVSQDILADYTKEYYTSTYKNPAIGNYMYNMTLLKESIDKSISSQGLETFLSGFFMGSVLKLPGALVNFTQNQINKYSDREAYERNKINSDTVAKNMVDSLNTMTKNGKYLFDPRLQNYGVQFSIGKNLDNKDELTKKQSKDDEFAGFFSAVMTSIQTGTFDMFLKNYAGYKDYTAKELEEAWNLEEGQGQKALDNIDKAIENARTIKNRYEFGISKFKKGPNPADFEDGSAEQLKAVVYNEAFQQAIHNFVFLGQSFDDTFKRVTKLVSKLSDIKAIKNSRFATAEPLFDFDKLDREIELLRSETESLKQTKDPKAQKEINNNETIISALEDFKKKQEEVTKFLFDKILTEPIYQEALDSEDEAVKEQAQKDYAEFLETYDETKAESILAYKESFNNLLKAMASTQSEQAIVDQEIVSAEQLDDLFTDVLDFHILKNENAELSQYISMISDPQGFYEHVNRNYDWMMEAYVRREDTFKDLVNQEFKAEALNSVLNHLAKQGIFIDLEQFAAFLENEKNSPEYFIDSKNRRYITKDNIFYNQYLKSLIEAKELSERKPAGEKSTDEELINKQKEEYMKDKAEEEALARRKYEKALKNDTGLTENEIAEKNIKDKEEAKAELERIEKEKETITEALDLIKKNKYEDLDAAVTLLSENQILTFQEINDLLDGKVDDEDFRKVYEKKFKAIAKANPNIDRDVLFKLALNASAIEELLDTKSKANENSVEELNKRVESDLVDLQNEPSYIAYQQELEAIEKKYNELISELEAVIKTDTAVDTKEMSTDMEWDDLDQELRIRLQPLFLQHLAKLGLSKDLQEVDEPEYNRIRANWLETQYEEIEKYNKEKLAKKAKLDEEAKTAPKFNMPFIKNVDINVLTLENLGAIRDIYVEGIEKGILTKPQTEEEKSKKIPPQTVELSPEDIKLFEEDLEKLDLYLDNRRNNYVPLKKYQEALQIINERILARQGEIELIKDEQGNVIGRTLNGKRADRPSQLSSEIADKEPFVYDKGLPAILAAFDAVQKEDTTDKFETFIDAFKKLRLPAFPAVKIDALAEELKKDFTEENLEKLVYKYIFKESSDTGTIIDDLTRQFLTPKKEGGFLEIVKPDNMSQEAFDNLYGPAGIITKVRDQLIDGKYMLLTQNFVMFDATLRENGVAGELDILAIEVDEETGDYKLAIIDIKTSKKTNWEAWGEETLRDNKLKYRAQLSIYANLLYNMTGLEVDIRLLPIEVNVTPSGEIKSAKLSSLVVTEATPEEKKDGKVPITLPLEYLPEVEKIGIIKKKPTFDTVQPTTQTQAEIIDRSSIPESVISIEVPAPTDDFMVSFTDEAGKQQKVYVGNNAQGNPYIKLNNPPLDNKGRRPSRNTVDTLARKYLGDGLVDFMLSWKALSKKDEQIIQYHVLGVPLRGALDSEFYNPVTIEEINQQYEDKISSEIKEGVDKYLKPFAQEALEKTVQRLEEDQKRFKVEKAKTKNKIIIDDYKKALSRFGTTQPQTGQTSDIEAELTEVTLNEALGQKVVYKGNIGILTLNDDGTYTIEVTKPDGTTRIEDITLNNTGVKDGSFDLNSLGIKQLRQTTTIKQTSVVNGKLLDVKFTNKSETEAEINGVKYKVNRNSKTGEIISLTYKVNDQKIAEIDEESSDLMNQLKDVRDALKLVKDNSERNNLLNAELDITDRLRELNKQRNKLSENNPVRTMRGSAQDYIFALNQLPNSYQKQSQKDTKVSTIRDKNKIDSLSVSSRVSDQIHNILAAEYPSEVDKLLEEGVDAMTKAELYKITLWAQQTIGQLEELALNLIDSNIPITDVENQILGLSDFLNDIDLINLTKDGRISKRQKQARQVFGPKAKGVSQRTDISQNVGPTRRQTQTVSGVTTREEVKKSIKTLNIQEIEEQELIASILGDTSKERPTVKSVLIESIENAKTIGEAKSAFGRALTEYSKTENREGEFINQLQEALDKRMLELAVGISLDTIEADEVLISKIPIFTNKSEELVLITSIKGNKVTVQEMRAIDEDGVLKKKTYTIEELADKFTKTDEMGLEEKITENVPEEISEETKESIKSNDEILDESSEEIVNAIVNEKDKESILNRIINDSKLC